MCIRDSNQAVIDDQHAAVVQQDVVAQLVVSQVDALDHARLCQLVRHVYVALSRASGWPPLLMKSQPYRGYRAGWARRSIPASPSIQKDPRKTQKIVVVVNPHALTTQITPERPQGLVSILDLQRESIGTADV